MVGPKRIPTEVCGGSAARPVVHQAVEEERGRFADARRSSLAERFVRTRSG